LGGYLAFEFLKPTAHNIQSQPQLRNSFSAVDFVPHISAIVAAEYFFWMFHKPPNGLRFTRWHGYHAVDCLMRRE